MAKTQTKITKLEWFDTHQKFETEWWGQAINTFGEELKQKTYAEKMGLKWENQKGHLGIDVHDATIMDIGGGFVSLLLKTFNLGRGVVVEPMKMPPLAAYRYAYANIGVSQQPAEELTSSSVWDEVWIYNVLQHTFDPVKILATARDISKIIRLFEWIDTPPHEGHPITLTEKQMNEWLHGEGRVERLDRNEWGDMNKCYYGVFLGKHYGKK